MGTVRGCAWTPWGWTRATRTTYPTEKVFAVPHADPEDAVDLGRDLRMLADVEILHTGTFNAVTGPATLDDDAVRDIIAASRDPEIRRAVNYVGHGDPDHETLGLGADGQPSKGYLDNFIVRPNPRNGQPTVYADVIGVPADLAERLPREYPGRSVEIRRDVTTPSGRFYKAVVTGLAWLGKTRAAIEGLAPVAGIYRNPTGAAFADGGETVVLDPDADVTADDPEVVATIARLHGLPGDTTPDRLAEHLSSKSGEVAAVPRGDVEADLTANTQPAPSDPVVPVVSETAPVGVVEPAVSREEEPATMPPTDPASAGNTAVADPPAPPAVTSAGPPAATVDAVANGWTADNADSRYAATRTLLGLPDTASDDDVEAHIADLRARADEAGLPVAQDRLAAAASEHGMVLLGADRVADYDRTVEQFAALQEQRRVEQRDSFLDRMGTEGRLSGGEREFFAAAYDRDPDSTRAYLAGRPEVVPVSERGHSDPGGDPAALAAAAEDEMIDRLRSRPLTAAATNSREG